MKTVANVKVPVVTQPVQVKLTRTERRVLDGLVNKKHYASRSAALRAGLGMLFEKHGMRSTEEAQIERERRMAPPRFSGRAR
jgi:Arc/MetJ-type ribon-helix-helix transcriptional regulator